MADSTFSAFGKISFKLEKSQFTLDNCQLTGCVYESEKKVTIEGLRIKNTFNPGTPVIIEFSDLLLRIHGILYECSLGEGGLSVTLENYSLMNAEGKIALKYRQPCRRIVIQGTPSGAEYAAVGQANICMVWVDPDDVGFVLAKKDGCCDGKRQSFYLANESDVRRWTNKGGQ